MSEIFDFVVIGGGSAGYAGASEASRLGLRTAVVDGAATLGGLCILRGCMPSKTLIESANRMMTLRRAGEFGLTCGTVGAEIGFIRQRKRRIIGEFAEHRQGQLADGRFELVRARASFIAPGVIRAGDREIRGKTFLVATGSDHAIPEVPGLRDAGFWTSDDALDLDRLPESVVILGGGAVALELAHFFSAMGVGTTVVQRSARVLKECDPDIAETVEHALAARGVVVATGTKLLAAEPGSGRKRVQFEHAGETCAVDAREIVVALGRKAAIGGLGLESVRVTVVDGRIATSVEQETNALGIFAAGDVCGPHEIVHLAIEQGVIAARNAARSLGKLGGPRERMDYRLRMFAVFTQPEIAQVGATESELAAEGRDFRVAKYPFADHGKAIVAGETEGFVKLLADPRSGEILGGAVAGPHASELIHEIAVAMAFRSTATQLAKVPHYHPTLSEIWTYPAEELAG